MSTPTVVKHEITYASLFRVVIVVFLVAAVWYLRDIILALLFAVVIASGIEPAIQWFRRRRLPRLVAVLIIYVMAAVIFAGVIYLILPAIADEFNIFLENYPIYQRELLKEFQGFRTVPFYSFFSDTVTDLIINPPFELGRLTTSTLGLLLSLFGGIFSGVILIVVSFYLASQERGIENFLRLILPLRYEEYGIDLWTRAQTKMGQWLRGQIILGLIMGVLVFIGLVLLGIRYALTLAVLAAIFELIPSIGPVLAAVPAVLIALLVSPLEALGVVLMYVLAQQLENHILVPTIMRRTVGLNPLVVIVALLIGSGLGGIIGLLLAVPFASVLAEFVADHDRRRRDALMRTVSNTVSTEAEA